MPLISLAPLVEFSQERYISKLVHDSPRIRVALFCLEPGQQVPPHSTSSEVVLQVMQGQGKIRVGEEELAAGAGTIVVCPPDAPHGFQAEEKLVIVALIAPPP
jgi:quercetin dioxygenase-like cupin family protein